MTRFYHYLVVVVVMLTLVLLTGIQAFDSQQYNYARKNFVLFVSEVQEYFKASSVIIVSDLQREHAAYKCPSVGLRVTTLMLHLTREFSRRSISSAVLGYSDLNRHQEMNIQPRELRPLVVVLLDTLPELEEFHRSSQRYEMSGALWLLFFASPNLLEVCYRPQGNYFNLAFDTEMLVKCKGDPTLREWYAIRENRTRIYDFAVWDRRIARLSLLSRKRSVYERRRNLYGSVLRLAVVKGSPFVKMVNGQPTGFFWSIIRELGLTLNFIPRVAHEEPNYGAYEAERAVWSGVIGRLTRGEADVGLDEFTMTESRLAVIDFSLPILQLPHLLFMRRLDVSNLQWFGYFRVYTVNVWITMQAMNILTTIVITIIRNALKERPISPGHFTENYFNVLSICSQQGLPDLPTAWPTRIAYWSIFMKAVILYAIYSACLISYLTVSSPNIPFANLAEFVDDGSYKLITFQHGAHYELLMTSNDPLIKKITKLIPPRSSLPDGLTEGFKQACNHKTAFYATGIMESIIESSSNCDLATLRTGGIDSIGIILVKDSQYTRIINYNLQRFKEFGIMKRLRTLVNARYDPPNNKYNPVNVEEIATSLSILVTGFVFSVLVLLIEMFTYRWQVIRHTRRSHENFNEPIFLDYVD